MCNKKFEVVGIQKTIMSPENTPCGEAQVLIRDDNGVYYRGNSMRRFKHCDKKQFENDFWLLKESIELDVIPQPKDVFTLFLAKKSGSLHPAEMCRDFLSEKWFNISQKIDFDFLLVSRRKDFNTCIASKIYDFFNNVSDRFIDKKNWSDALICGRILLFCGKWHQNKSDKIIKSATLIAKCLKQMEYSQESVLNWLQFVQIGNVAIIPERILEQVFSPKCILNRKFNWQNNEELIENFIQDNFVFKLTTKPSNVNFFNFEKLIYHITPPKDELQGDCCTVGSSQIFNKSLDIEQQDTVTMSKIFEVRKNCINLEPEMENVLCPA